MSPTGGNDDDDGSVIIIRRKAKEVLTAPVESAKRWHFAAVALVAFLIGLAL